MKKEKPIRVEWWAEARRFDKVNQHREFVGGKSAAVAYAAEHDNGDGVYVWRVVRVEIYAVKGKR